MLLTLLKMSAGCGFLNSNIYTFLKDQYSTMIQTFESEITERYRVKKYEC